MGDTIPTARMRAKAEVRGEIIAEARRQLALEGAPALSLRAVTRQLGMASSAVYRYFPSRDDLFTALIVEAYDALGAVAEAAVATAGPAVDRWRRLSRSIRGWALEHPHEYALIYGSPIPGYHAPELTIGPASRVTLAMARLVAEAYQTGELIPVDEEALTSPVAEEAGRVGQAAMPGVPLPVVARAVVAWTQLFGQISFELFGQMANVVEDPAVLFDHSITVMSGVVGLRPQPAVSGRPLPA
jgi:AcrR family transcriptional regulator